MSRLSIRWRITVWNTVAFAVVLVSFGILIYWLLRKTHHDQLDRGLVQAFRSISSQSRDDLDSKTLLQQWSETDSQHGHLSAGIFNEDGNLVARSEDFPGEGMRPATEYLTHPRFDTVTVNRERYRRLTAPLDAAADPQTLVLLVELEHVDEEMAQVAWVLGTTIPCTLVIAAVLAYFLARTALAPVESLRRQTDEITADRLDQRLPIANPKDELGLLGKTINEMIVRLECSFQEIKRFTADASHELRTPLAIIRSEAELTMDSATSLEEVNLRCASIVEECARLTALTDQLLLLSREDAGVSPHRMENVELSGLMAEVAEDLRPWIESKQITLSTALSKEACVRGDAASLRRVLLNLLDNAVKFTSSNGRIEITLQRHSGEALIEIHDTGSGISAEDLPHVFDRFYRGRTGQRSETGGSGLGLSIVKSIVVFHEGRIDIQSGLQEGTTVRISLPICG